MWKLVKSSLPARGLASFLTLEPGALRAGGRESRWGDGGQAGIHKTDGEPVGVSAPAATFEDGVSCERR